ncbi:Vegetative incompatibility protein HET-E-1 [Cladobotryum mycophilum]|uniref:Vegetative incompatibility protein HET-E-1 n=1 Tax=Cladobotryum mycophilum TaxID=491253 RepID=A0ABR0T1X5_9HYPO
MGPKKIFTRLHTHFRSGSRSRPQGGDSVQVVQDGRTTPSTSSTALSVPEPKPEHSIKITEASQEAFHDHYLPALTVTGPTTDLKPSLDPAVVYEIENKPPTLAETIWDSAYDELKTKEAALVQAYEKILSRRLQGSDVTSSELESERNAIEQHDKDSRRYQMYQLVNAGLEKISREAKIKENLGTAIETVTLFKDIVRAAIREAPQAALPWAAVSLSLEILANPITQTKTNREGVNHVIKSMNWYCELVRHLVKDKQKDGEFAGVQRELQTKLVDLYKKLLSFEMRSIYCYHRHRGLVFLRDLIKLDDWDGSVKAVQESEAYFRELTYEFVAVKSESHLKQIAAFTKTQEEHQKTEKDIQCLRDLYITDPRIDKNRIESTKGGLFQDSFCWILENPDFKSWLRDSRRLLWLRGDPGKGKTMLLSTVPSINNHLAVLRGLIWLFADQQPCLISHIRKQYDPAGKDIFEGFNAWHTLSDIFRNILLDERLRTSYVVIDALDECTTGLTELLGLIQNLPPLSNTKWIVSSRNWPEIEKRLIGGVGLSLEVNAALVSASVDAYISYKASQILFLQKDSQLEEKVRLRISELANGTFLWVAIVFKRLQDIEDTLYDKHSEVLAILDEIPEDLEGLYSIMLQQISQKRRDLERCRAILAITTLAYRPLHLQELAALAGFKDNLAKPDQMESLIKKCGSFLTVRDNTVYFIHQSAKEYLTCHPIAQSILYPGGIGEILHTMAINSLTAMEAILRQNIYGLDSPGTLVGDICMPDPDPLESVRYSCIHWMGHLCEATVVGDSSKLQDDLSNGGMILTFLKTHFLHWLEVISLTRNPSGGILDIGQLEGLLKPNNSSSELLKFIHDARRFTQYYSWIIENAPLQIYSSAILFSPEQSVIRTLFHHMLPSWIKPKFDREAVWSPCLQTIETESSSSLMALAISNDMKILTSGYKSDYLRIWDITSGKQIQEFKNTSTDGILSWDMNSGALIEDCSLPSHTMSSKYFVFSLSDDGKFIAVCPTEDTIQIQDMATRKELYVVHDPDPKPLRKLNLSNNAKFLAFGDESVTIWDLAAGNVTIWDLDTGTKNRVLNTNNESHSFYSIKFSKNSELIAAVGPSLAFVWDVATGETLHELGCEGTGGLLEWTNNAKVLASSKLREVKIWDLTEPKKSEVMATHKGAIQSIAISNDLKLAASTAEGIADIKIWDTTTSRAIQTIDLQHWWTSHRKIQLAFSPDSKFIYVYHDYDNFWKLNITSGIEIQHHLIRKDRYTYSNVRSSAALSIDGRLFAEGNEGVTNIWDLVTENSIQDIIHVGETMVALAFSNNSNYLASLSTSRIVSVWDAATGEKIREMTLRVCSKSDDDVQDCECCTDKLNNYERQIAISNDGLSVLAPDDNYRVWLLYEGKKKRISRHGVSRLTVPGLSFDDATTSILTASGRINLSSFMEKGEFMMEGYGKNENWITWNGKNILWLPPDYRGDSHVASQYCSRH